MYRISIKKLFICSKKRWIVFIIEFENNKKLLSLYIDNNY